MGLVDKKQKGKEKDLRLSEEFGVGRINTIWLKVDVTK